MPSRRDVLAALATGAVTVTACTASAPGRPSASASAAAPVPALARPAAVPSPARSRISHALTGGSGPDGSVDGTRSAGVALTFDDGPDPGTTPRLLDLLGEHGIKASFSLVGWRARDHPEIVQRMANEGHTLVNHSWQHLMDLGRRPRSYVQWDLTNTTRMIQEAAPGTPVSYFRAPGGNFTPSLVQIIRQFRMTPLFWDLDPRDWDSATYGFGAPMVQHIVHSVESAVRPGMIVLSHDCKHPDTITAYATLLPWLKSRYALVALPT